MNSLPPNFLLSAGPATMRLSASFANPAGGTPAMTAADLTSRSLLRTELPSTLVARRSSGFTLIELLVVISIIAILAGLAFPAVNGALNSARKAEARNDVQQIVAAVKAFQAEYGRMPTSDINNNSSDFSDNYYSSNRNIIRALLGQDTTLNPKGISFLEVKSAGRNRSGLNSSGEFVDPWGQSYMIKLDTNYNGRTEYYGDRFFSVIVFSSGPDKSPGNPNDGSAPGKDDICSFK
jgi:prepilin-type N-terminal cleavage/methylation domain-containing protein